MVLDEKVRNSEEKLYAFSWLIFNISKMSITFEMLNFIMHMWFEFLFNRKFLEENSMVPHVA